MNDEKLALVSEYLKESFPGCSVSSLSVADNEYLFRVTTADNVHNVRVQESFLRTVDVADIKTTLDQYRLAQTLRDLGDFPLLVSANGCIFA